MLIPNVDTPHIFSFFFLNPFNLSLLTNIFHFFSPGRLDILDLKCCELVIFAKPPRSWKFTQRPTNGHSGPMEKQKGVDKRLLGGHAVSRVGQHAPIWPCREGRNPISSHLATRNRGAKPIFWVWFDWEGSVFLAAMLRKVPACNNLRIFRKEIREY